MKKTLLSLLLTTLFIYQSNAQWVKGTSGTSLAVGVTNFIQSGTKLLAATNGYGVFSSADNGVSWTKTSYPTTYAWQIAGAGNDVVAGSWNDGVYYSADNGGTWAQVNSGLTDKSVYGIAIVGSNVIAATASGVFKSANKGAAWSLVNPIELDAITVSSGKLYSRSLKNIMVSSDLGTTWTVFCASPGGMGLDKLVFSGSEIYAVDSFNLYKSTTNGSTWSKIYSGGSDDAMDVAVSGSSIVLATYNGALTSSNNGVNWTDITSGLNVSFYEPQTAFYSNNRFFINVRETGIYYRDASDLTSINEISDQEHISLYPNPASESFYLVNAENSELNLMNPLGELVLSTIINNNQESIDISNLKPGIYFAIIQSKEKSLVKELIIR